MEVEAMLRHLPQQQQQDFNFDSTSSSPYVTAPSSPQLFGFGRTAAAGHHHFYNLSAPASPTGSSSSALFRRELNRSRKSIASIPFDWEEKPGIPKLKWGARASSGDDGGEGDDFEFDFSGQLDIGSCVSASADELFDGGKIRPLKLPPRLQVGEYDDTASLGASPRTPTRSIKFSPKKRVVEKELTPFTDALQETRKTKQPGRAGEEDHQHRRGRDRSTGSSSSSNSWNYTRRETRSLSPFRVSDVVFHDQKYDDASSEAAATLKAENPKPSNYFTTLLSSITDLSSRGYRKWSFKDFLLFRSASEGRGTSSDPLRKFNRKTSSVVAEEDSVRGCSSFRSTDSMDSGRRRRRSAHEVHYAVNRAASEEMRRKTFLPYKQGLLGCLGFNPAVHELARGIGSLTRGTS